MDGGQCARTVARLRAEALEAAARDARRQWLVRDLDVGIQAQVASEPPPLLPELRLTSRDVDALVEAEVVATLGIGTVAAGSLVDLARRLHDDLADTLTALEAGRLDLTRVRALADLTRDLPGPVVTLVQDVVLPGAGSAPWEGPSALTWRRRIRRAVKRFRLADQAEEARSLAAQTRTWVQVDENQPALSTFSIVAPTEDILWLDAAVTDCALRRPDTDARGRSLTIGQRRVAARFDVFEQVVVGRDPADALTTVPGTPAGAGAGAGVGGGSRGRERELGLVLHADTFFGDGPAADDPGEVRGLGAPAPIDADSARELAHGRAASASTCVLLADHTGGLHRLVRVGRPPPGGWTRNSLVATLRARLAKEEATMRDRLSTDCYAPPTAIADHVRARYPICTRPGCHRTSRGCDLDHDEPWPRGPTSITNLNPKSRRCHRWKTLGLWRSRMHADGAVTWTSYAGTRLTHRPEPLPEYGLGEAYAATGHTDIPAA